MMRAKGDGGAMKGGGAMKERWAGWRYKCIPDWIGIQTHFDGVWLCQARV